MRTLLRRLSPAVTAILALAVIAAKPADTPRNEQKPFDYIAQADRLSQPAYTSEKFATTVTAFDGEEIYVEVTLPDPRSTRASGGR